MISFTSANLFLVTGAGRGIGQTLAVSLNELGARTVILSKNIDNLTTTKNLCRYPDSCFPVSNDLSCNIDCLPALVSDLAAQYGKFSGFVHCAGIQQTLPLGSLSAAKMKEIFDINYFSAISLVKGFCKKANNIGAGSSIVLVSSITSKLGIPGTLSYSSTKGAINSAVKELCAELSRNGIRINSVLPGHIETELWKNDKNINIESKQNELKGKYPLGLGSPQNVADLICFLLSSRASWINGQEIIIDGGASSIF